MSGLPRAMQYPRKSKPLTGETKDAWYYVQPGQVEVLTQHINGAITGARLTRAQLVRALAIIDAHA